MAQVAVVTDSTASLPLEMYERYQISMVPYYIHYDGRAARDMVDVMPVPFGEYMRGLPDDAELPRTANPGPGDYLERFLALAEKAGEIVSFHMTSTGSGAFQAATIGRDMALQRLRGVRIEVVDTRNVSMCHGWITLQAARAAADGATLDDILALAQRMLPVTHMIQTADTLRYLYMGGRIGRASHLLSSVLNIKPLVSMEDGEITTLGVARSRMGAYKRIVSLVERAVEGRRNVRVALTHAVAHKEAEQLGQMVRQAVHPVEMLMCDLSPALSVHSGPGTVGLCYTLE
ncbi:MAG TPA: DegV family protein [Chloroflexi bacterium]|nr:DegV family protein [Chloroflexota bacterium]